MRKRQELARPLTPDLECSGEYKDLGLEDTAEPYYIRKSKQLPEL